jgi:hypothetical protein
VFTARYKLGLYIRQSFVLQGLIAQFLLYRNKCTCTAHSVCLRGGKKRKNKEMFCLIDLPGTRSGHCSRYSDYATS